MHSVKIREGIVVGFEGLNEIEFGGNHAELSQKGETLKDLLRVETAIRQLRFEECRVKVEILHVFELIKRRDVLSKEGEQVEEQGW